MILDNISRAALYEGLGARIGSVFAFLKSRDPVSLENGRIDIDGNNVFALVQSYDSKPLEKGFWEAHRKYIDLQYIVAGRERIGFAAIERMQPESHDESRDLSVLTGSGDFALLGAGDFMLLWPSDVHMPGLQVDGPEPVRKIVFKIAVD